LPAGSGLSRNGLMEYSLMKNFIDMQVVMKGSRQKKSPVSGYRVPVTKPLLQMADSIFAFLETGNW